MASRTLRLTAAGYGLFLSLFAAFISGCLSVTLISDYDEATDKALTALQQSTDDFITKLIADAPSEKNAFDKHKDFYEDADQQLRRLEFRVNSIPKNGKTIKLVANIRTVLLGKGQCSAEGASLKDLHCNPEALAKGPSRKALEATQSNINQTIGAALALELAKKQGSEKNK